MKTLGKSPDKRVYWAAVAAVIILRLAMTRDVYLTFLPDTVHDDIMQFVKALYFADGEYMGPYLNTTLIKGVVFPALLGASIKLELDFVLLTQVIYVLACLAALVAAAPVHKYDLSSIFLFAFLAFNPLAFDSSVVRTYRDAVYHSIALFALACVVGFALRRSNERRTPANLFAFFSGFALCAAFNTREDTQWLTVFFAAGFAVYAVFALTDKTAKSKIKDTAAVGALIIAGYAALALPICAANYANYGVFVQNEYTTGAFGRAYAALTRPYSEQNDPHYPVTRDVRERLYELSPSFETLKQSLDNPDSHVYAWTLGQGDYPNSHLTWALRDAAAEQGYYSDASAAKDFWSAVANEVNAACDEGKIESRGGRAAGISAPFETRFLGDILKYTCASVRSVLTAAEVGCYPSFPEIDADVAERYKEILGCGISYSYRNEHGKLFYSPDVLKGSLVSLGFVPVVYRYLPSALAVLCAALAVFAALKKKSINRASAGYLAVIAAGLWLAFLLRCLMMGYMSATSFDVTYAVNYNAAGFCALYLAEAFTLSLLISRFRSEQTE